MANVHLDPTAMMAIEDYMHDNDILSKSRAVNRLIATADMVQVLELLVAILRDENKRLKNLRGSA